MTKSFPPADALISALREIEYKKHANNFMDVVETICLWIAAVAVVVFPIVVKGVKNAYQKLTAFWDANGEQITDKVYIYSWVAYKRTKDFIAEVNQMRQLPKLVTVA
jgi:predicted PurR-regulated permease PerM